MELSSRLDIDWSTVRKQLGLPPVRVRPNQAVRDGNDDCPAPRSGFKAADRLPRWPADPAQTAPPGGWESGDTRPDPGTMRTEKW